METNYFGAVRCVKEVLPRMRKRGSGCIINVTSVAGRVAFPATSAYCASKFALEAFTESLAQEVKGYGIKVALVEPGIIDTAMATTNLPRYVANTIYPHGRRIHAFFTNPEKPEASPTLVGEMIRYVIESHDPRLRFPVGPDAPSFLGWRGALSDEDWVGLSGLVRDADYFERVLLDTGVDLRWKHVRKTPPAQSTAALCLPAPAPLDEPLAMLSTGDFKRGLRLLLDGDPYVILDVHVQTPSARGASSLTKVKVRNLRTGQVFDRTFRGGDKVDEPNLAFRPVQFLYRDADGFHFMDTQSYEQFALSADDVGAGAGYLTEGLEGIRSVVFNDRVIALDLPNTVTLRVAETGPALKGATATAQTKPATLETGLVIQVPSYLEAGELVIVDTRDGRFTGRARG